MAPGAVRVFVPGQGGGTAAAGKAAKVELKSGKEGAFRISGLAPGKAWIQAEPAAGKGLEAEMKKLREDMTDLKGRMESLRKRLEALEPPKKK